AFQVTSDVPEIYMQEFWATAKLHHNSIRFKMDTKKSVFDLEAFREMLHISPRIPSQSFVELPSEEEILEFLRNLRHSHEIRHLIDVNVVTRHQTTQQYGAILPIELTNDDIRNSKAYKEHYACATGEAAPKPKASANRECRQIYHRYPHNLLQPLPLIPDNRGRRVISFKHFINNDLEYLWGGLRIMRFVHHEVCVTEVCDTEVCDTKGEVDRGKALDDDLVVTESSGTESKKHDTNCRPGNDTHAEDADIKPVNYKEPMAEVQTTAKYNVLANKQQHAEQPEFNTE
nr:hypothetical protein [Tanacetum cinerariifolium]